MAWPTFVAAHLERRNHASPIHSRRRRLGDRGGTGARARPSGRRSPSPTSCRSPRAGRPTCSRASSGRNCRPRSAQPVIIDNKPGAGGNIGSDFVAKATPDGYTILGGTISSHAINPSLYPKMPYDAVKSLRADHADRDQSAGADRSADSPYNDAEGLDRAAKAKPGLHVVRLGGQRHLAAPFRRVAEVAAGIEHGARALQGQRPRDPGRDGRAGR